MSIPLDIPIACDLTDDETAVRRQESMNAFLSRVAGHEALADGYAFRFPSRDEIARDLLDFVLLERQCCPFFHIELAFTPDGGPIWLRLRGGDGVKQFVETELAAVLQP